MRWRPKRRSSFAPFKLKSRSGAPAVGLVVGIASRGCLERQRQLVSGGREAPFDAGACLRLLLGRHGSASDTRPSRHPARSLCAWRAESSRPDAVRSAAARRQQLVWLRAPRDRRTSRAEVTRFDGTAHIVSWIRRHPCARAPPCSASEFEHAAGALSCWHILRACRGVRCAPHVRTAPPRSTGPGRVARAAIIAAIVFVLRRQLTFGVMAAAATAVVVSGCVLLLVICDRAAARVPIAPRYTVLPGSYTPQPRFVVTYDGSGSWRTVYHSEPPNPSGAHDANDARDSSAEHWSLRFARDLAIGRCGACTNLASLNEALGATSASGSIDHTHIDGLFSFDNVSERCRVKARTPADTPLPATVSVRYLPVLRSVALTALIPVSKVFVLLAQACPGQGDSIDGLADNYFMPGFSFAAGWGPERWFAAAPVLIPVSELDRAARITIREADTAQGTPPRGCGVGEPSYERCRTGGSWRGTLTLSAVG